MKPITRSPDSGQTAAIQEKFECQHCHHNIFYENEIELVCWIRKFMADFARLYLDYHGNADFHI